MTDEPQVLYRMYDQDDQLLYVGITAIPSARFNAHRADKPWWPQVATVRLEHFANREDVRAAEIAAILDESPLYNIANRLPVTTKRPRITLPQPCLEDSLTHLASHEPGGWCWDCEGWPHESVTGESGWCVRCDVHADDHEWFDDDLKVFGPIVPRPRLHVEPSGGDQPPMRPVQNLADAE